MPMFRAEMLRCYRVSRSNAAYTVVFSLIWFGAIVGFLIIPLLRQFGWSLAQVAVGLGLLPFAVLPALITASSPYSISLIDDEQCEFRGLLRQRRLRVQQVRAIEWDEMEIEIIHDRGKVRILAGDEYLDFLARLFELNPAIKATDETRRLLSSTED
jgi:hypothetical protein